MIIFGHIYFVAPCYDQLLILVAKHPYNVYLKANIVHMSQEKSCPYFHAGLIGRITVFAH